MFRPTEARRFRLAPIWPEWDEAEINNETWDTGIITKKNTGSARSRAEAKANISVVRSKRQRFPKEFHLILKGAT